MDYCYLCKRTVTFPIDHPLHFTNWNLPNKQTYPVCSEECKQILLDQYELDLRISKQHKVKHAVDRYEKVKRIYEIVKSYETATDSEIYNMFYAVENIVDKDYDEGY